MTMVDWRVGERLGGCEGRVPSRNNMKKQSRKVLHRRKPFNNQMYNEFVVEELEALRMGQSTLLLLLHY